MIYPRLHLEFINGNSLTLVLLHFIAKKLKINYFFSICVTMKVLEHSFFVSLLLFFYILMKC